MPPAKGARVGGGTSMILVLALLGCVLFFVIRSSGRFSGPEIELVEAPTTMFSNTNQQLVWEVTLSEGFVSASQFTLHMDEESHYGTFGKGMEQSESGYTRVLYAQPEMLDDGRVRLAFTLYERKPVLLYYRLHLLIDGKHYWTPETALSIKHRPAFTEEFQDSHLKETLQHLSFVG